MIRRTYAAVDLGASSGRVITGRVEGGRVVTEEVGRFPNAAVPVPTRGGTTLHWDVLALWSGILDGLRRAATGGDLAAVGIDSWAVDHGLLDADGALLATPCTTATPAPTGCPSRSSPTSRPRSCTPRPASRSSRSTRSSSSRGRRDAGPGRGPARPARPGPARVLADRRGGRRGHQRLDHRAARRPRPGLVGEVVARLRDGVRDRRRRPAPAGGRAGHRPRSPAPGDPRPLGLAPAGRPGGSDGAGGPHLITVGSARHRLRRAAVPAEREDFAYISCGTWSLVGLELDAPVLTEASRAANLTNELGVDGTVRYLRNVMGLWVLQETLRTWRERGQDADLADLLAAAADVPALRCVVDVDDPVFLPPGDMAARIADTARRTGQRPPQTPAETVRCILDSLALAYRRAVRTAAGLAGREVGVVHLVGGGADNPLLCRLTADATGLPVVAGPTEGAALGNLLVQAQALGDVAPGLPALAAVVAASTQPPGRSPPATDAAWDHAEDLLRP